MYTAMYTLLLAFSIVRGEPSTWAYRIQGRTTTGQLCLADCIKNECIVDWQGNRKPCLVTGLSVPQYRTAQLENKEKEYCLSNCGNFGYPYEWCVVSEKKDWDFCNSATYHRSVYKKKCKSPCDKLSGDYYWCFVEGGSYQFCALPATSEELFDIRKMDS